MLCAGKLKPSQWKLWIVMITAYSGASLYCWKIIKINMVHRGKMCLVLAGTGTTKHKGCVEKCAQTTRAAETRSDLLCPDALPLWCASLSLCSLASLTLKKTCQLCSEPLDLMAPVDRAAWARARETVHIYWGTRDGSRARVVWTHLKRIMWRCSVWRPCRNHSHLRDS
jgi:hypothetical protein